MPCKGRRGKLGALHGPMNHEYLSGTHPALLVGLRCNSDVQLPYRFPIHANTHISCEENCLALQLSEEECINQAQWQQDAQTGYSCDYCTKRQPAAFNEVKECCKGHAQLNAKLAGESVQRVGKRHVSRLMSDAYGKGIVRGQAESTNLRANISATDTTKAESFKTCPLAYFDGSDLVTMIEIMNGSSDEQKVRKRPLYIDKRDRLKKQGRVK